MNANTVYQGILMGCMVILAILILLSVIRSVKGPKIADRVIAVNMIGTMTIVVIAVLSVYQEEDYLTDVCLIYAMVSFLAVVVLTKVYTGIYLERKGIRGDIAAIADNLERQEMPEGQRTPEAQVNSDVQAGLEAQTGSEAQAGADVREDSDAQAAESASGGQKQAARLCKEEG